MPTFQKLALGLILAGATLHWEPAQAEDAIGAESAQKVTLAITAQPLGEALNEWASQTGYQVLLSSKEEAGNRMSPALSGSFTPEAALQQLLANSGLKYEFVAARTVTILSASASAPSSSTSSLHSPGDENVQSSLKLAQGNASSSDPSASSPGQGSDEQNSADSEEKSPGATLDQIIVTATKRTEDVMDVPMSIAVIGNQDIERRGLIGMEDYLRSIPGVNQIDNGPRSNAIVIRGISTSPEFENYSSGTTVATYFDETPITGAAGLGTGGIDVRPVDMERIEVLRGPQGTAYGSSSLGGTMRIIPVKPRLDSFSAKLAASYSDTAGTGSGNSMAQGVINIPVVENKLALRAVGYRYDESGFYRNVAGTDPSTIAFATTFGLGEFVRGHVQDEVGQTVSTGGRLAALWEPTDQVSLSMNFLQQKIEQDGSPVATTGKYEQIAIPVAPQVSARVRGEVGETTDTDIELLNLALSYDLRWATLTSIASWVDSGSVWTGSGISPYPYASYAPSDFESFTAETRLASQLDGRIQFLAGLFYENVENSFVQTAEWPGTPETSLLGTNPMGYYGETRDLDQRAIFGEISYDLTDKLIATVGGRYFEYEKNDSQLREGGSFNIPIGAGVRSFLESRSSDSIFKANLSYKPTKQALLYASWAEGFRLGRPSTGLPPAICDTNNDGIADGSNVSIQSTQSINSDFLENYEIGGKFTLFDRRMVVDTSVYHIKWDGLPIRTVPPCGFAYTANVGEATSDGVELQASLFIAEGLRVDFGGGYVRAELSKDAPGLIPPAFEGDRLPGSPKVSANFAAQYDFEIAGHDAFVRADSFYAGEFYGDLRQIPATLAGGYIKVDARAGVAIKNLSVEFFVRNLTNEDAFTWRGLRARSAFYGYRLRPRTIGMQLGYNF